MPELQPLVARASMRWWNVIANYAEITGIGLILAFIAMGYGGIVHGIFAVPMVVLGIFCWWSARGLRRRYLRHT